MAAVDTSGGVESPATRAFALSVGDLARVTRGVYVGGAGDLVCTLVDDTEPSTFVGVLAGMWYPYRIKKIGAGTTATNLVGLY